MNHLQNKNKTTTVTGVHQNFSFMCMLCRRCLSFVLCLLAIVLCVFRRFTDSDSPLVSSNSSSGYYGFRPPHNVVQNKCQYISFESYFLAVGNVWRVVNTPDFPALID